MKGSICLLVLALVATSLAQHHEDKHKTKHHASGKHHSLKSKSHSRTLTASVDAAVTVALGADVELTIVPSANAIVMVNTALNISAILDGINKELIVLNTKTGLILLVDVELGVGITKDGTITYAKGIDVVAGLDGILSVSASLRESLKLGGDGTFEIGALVGAALSGNVGSIDLSAITGISAEVLGSIKDSFGGLLDAISAIKSLNLGSSLEYIVDAVLGLTANASDAVKAVANLVGAILNKLTGEIVPELLSKISSILSGVTGIIDDIIAAKLNALASILKLVPVLFKTVSDALSAASNLIKSVVSNIYTSGEDILSIDLTVLTNGNYILTATLHGEIVNSVIYLADSNVLCIINHKLGFVLGLLGTTGQAVLIKLGSGAAILINVKDKVAYLLSSAMATTGTVIDLINSVVAAVKTATSNLPKLDLVKIISNLLSNVNDWKTGLAANVVATIETEFADIFKLVAAAPADILAAVKSLVTVASDKIKALGLDQLVEAVLKYLKGFFNKTLCYIIASVIKAAMIAGPLSGLVVGSLVAAIAATGVLVLGYSTAIMAIAAISGGFAITI